MSLRNQRTRADRKGPKLSLRTKGRGGEKKGETNGVGKLEKKKKKGRVDYSIAGQE